MTKTETEKQIVLGRVGHYREQGECRLAFIVKAWSQEVVNLAGFDASGNWYARSSVRVGEVSEVPSFHLNRDCPEGA